MATYCIYNKLNNICNVKKHLKKLHPFLNQYDGIVAIEKLLEILHNKNDDEIELFFNKYIINFITKKRYCLNFDINNSYNSFENITDFLYKIENNQHDFYIELKLFLINLKI